jgi:monovalent cation:H+ antiporter, CPA1 family
VALLAGAVLVGVVAQRLRIPYSVALLIAALPAQLPHLDESFTPSLLFVFLPALVFEAAWNVDGSALRRCWLPITVLAVPGVLLTAALVAGGLAITGLMPFLPALVLGAILAATDPIAVIATFRRMRVPADLETIVEGESLFNDGVAIVLYTVAVGALSAGSGHIDPLAVGVEALAVGLGGAAVGFVCAAIVALALVRTEDTLLQVVGTIVAAYGAYLVADEVHTSGILAAVVAGIAIRGFRRFPTPEATVEVDRFWAVLAFIATTLVFVLMGLRIEFARIVHEPLLVLLTLALVTAARVLVTYLGLPLAGVRGDQRGWHHVILCSGMRGALSIALALALPSDLPYRSQLIDAAFGVVVVTLVVQGLSIGPLLVAQRLSEPRPAKAA